MPISETLPNAKTFPIAHNNFIRYMQHVNEISLITTRDSNCAPSNLSCSMYIFQTTFLSHGETAALMSGICTNMATGRVAWDSRIAFLKASTSWRGSTFGKSGH